MSCFSSLLFVLQCFEGIVEWVNHHVFVFVAIYGDSFTSSASKTWKLFQDSGLTVMFNDSH